MEIMSKTRVAGKLQYRIKYTDGKVYNCDWINRPLLDHYEAKRRSYSHCRCKLGLIGVTVMCTITRLL